ncbi:MAG: UvrD-helicase domain-containing protein, partial [Clostridia bacterium]|nr:UvrD-helicase domain-containing protein [Clostridia bacterium]
MKSNLTPEQIRAINSNKRKILVSASAGTGKTFTMVERILRLLVKDNKDLENFLVLTFTNDAAEEMKGRIKSKLTQKLSQFPMLKKQVKKLSTANISTIHSFCSEILKRYFYAISLPPKFKIIDEARATFLKNKVLSDLIDDLYEEGAPEFLRLSGILLQGRTDDNLMRTILGLYNYSLSFEDPEKFLQDSAALHSLEFYEEALNNYLNFRLSLFASKFAVEDFIYEEENNFALLCKELIEKDLEGKLEIVSTNPVFSSKVNSLFVSEKLTDKFKNEFIDIFKSFDILTKEQFDVIKGDVSVLCDICLTFKKLYDEEKKKSNAFDFSDLEHYTLKLLQNENVLLDLQEKYSYVFVDEYQDVNDIQEKIISLIAQKSNLFMVGDLKQSIYLFRQCNMNIFAKKLKDYQTDEDAEICFLNKNFRSNSDILTFVNDFFQEMMTENTGINYRATSMFDVSSYDSLPTSDNPLANCTEKAVIAQNVVAKEPSVEIVPICVDLEKRKQEPIIYSVENDEVDLEERISAKIEGKYIAHEIKRITKVGIMTESGLKKIDYKDICILSRSVNTPNVNQIYKTLLDEGIPVKIATSEANLFDYAEVLQCVNFLKVLQNHKNDLPLISVLKSPFFSFTDSELYEIKKCANTTFYHDAFNKVPSTSPLYPKIANFKQKIELYRSVALARGGMYALKRAISELPFEINVIAKEDGEDRINRVYSFIAKISLIDEDKNLTTLNSQIDYISKNSKLQGAFAVKNSNAVNLMTIHKSKGLEFPVVFLVNTGGKIYHERSSVFTNRELGFSLDYYSPNSNKILPSISKLAIEKYNQKENAEENLRILYVALTRAKQKLYITGTRDYKISKYDDIPKDVNELDVLNEYYPLFDKDLPNFRTCKNQKLISTRLFPYLIDFDVYTYTRYLDLILGASYYPTCSYKLLYCDGLDSQKKKLPNVVSENSQAIKDAIESNL